MLLLAVFSCKRVILTRILESSGMLIGIRALLEKISFAIDEDDLACLSICIAETFFFADGTFSINEIGSAFWAFIHLIPSLHRLWRDS